MSRYYTGSKQIDEIKLFTKKLGQGIISDGYDQITSFGNGGVTLNPRCDWYFTICKM